jgi:hypothetical protein
MIMTASQYHYVGLILLAALLTSCSSFDEQRLTAHIRNQLPAHDTTPRVVAGDVLHTVQTTRNWEEVYVAYYDTTATLQIVTGDFERAETKDTQLVLSDVAGAPPPRTLSVAMRAVGGVYRPTEYPEMRKIDPLKTALWVVLALPAILITSTLLFAMIGDAINPHAPPGWFRVSDGAEVGAVIGFFTGLITWVVLTK